MVIIYARARAYTHTHTHTHAHTQTHTHTHTSPAKHLCSRNGSHLTILRVPHISKCHLLLLKPLMHFRVVHNLGQFLWQKFSKVRERHTVANAHSIFNIGIWHLREAPPVGIDRTILSILHTTSLGSGLPLNTSPQNPNAPPLSNRRTSTVTLFSPSPSIFFLPFFPFSASNDFFSFFAECSSEKPMTRRKAR